MVMQLELQNFVVFIDIFNYLVKFFFKRPPSILAVNDFARNGFQKRANFIFDFSVDVVINVSAQIRKRGSETFEGIEDIFDFCVAQIKIFGVQIDNFSSELSNRYNRENKVRDAINKQDNGCDSEK
jgi:hypothetical protein